MSALSSSRIVALIDEASRPMPLLWPLSNAVAANPLWDLRTLAFRDALTLASRVFTSVGYPSASLFASAYRAGRITDADLVAARAEHDAPKLPPDRGTERLVRLLWECAPGMRTRAERHDHHGGAALAQQSDREVTKWAAAYLAGVVPEVGGGGFYRSWSEAVRADRQGQLLGLPGAAGGAPPADAISGALVSLGVIDEEAILIELVGQLARLPGWAGLAKWQSRWAAPDRPGPRLDLVDYLAVRLAYDAAFVSRADAVVSDRGAPRRASSGAPRRERRDAASDVSAMANFEQIAEASDEAERWLVAYEGHYRDELLGALGSTATGLQPRTRSAQGMVMAQVVCCIDARAEGLRRHLEAVGDYETFGFAGFFGIPARFRPFASDDALDLCPVLVRPPVEVNESRLAQPGRLASERALVAADRSFRSARKGALSGYLLAEASGFALGPLAALRSVAPRAFAAARTRLRTRPVDVERRFVLEGAGAPSDAEQAFYLETALRTMGLTSGFAPLVVFCGHGSTTENNPYAASLDCGACGAARGGASAGLAAAIGNRPAVRALLNERGILVPETTVFVAAEHDTTSDTVTVAVPAGELLEAQAAHLGVLRRDLARAAAALAAERETTLPLPSRGRAVASTRRVAARSTDWAQVQPEWGLARCAAFVVADRRLTRGVDLERRVFLHSYDRDADADGAVLETILTGPMVVAQWISAAYYFSTVDPLVYGAGDKVAHNIVAGLGVYQGAGGDLKLGLPRQAVFDQDRPYHEPMRLLVVLDAPRARIDAVISANEVVSALVDGAWIHVVARDDERFWTRERRGTWRPWRPARCVAGAPDNDAPGRVAERIGIDA